MNMEEAKEILKRIYQQKRDIERVNPQGYFHNETKEEVEALSFALSVLGKLDEEKIAKILYIADGLWVNENPKFQKWEDVEENVMSKKHYRILSQALISYLIQEGEQK